MVSRADHFVERSPIPIQVEKAKRSEQSVAVCVLEMCGSGDAKVPSRQYLLVQRPKEGLLAGEAEGFYTVIHTSYSKYDTMLTLSIALPQLTGRFNELGADGWASN